MTEGIAVNLDDLLAGVKNRTETVDDLLAKSSPALDALLILHADLVKRHGRDTGFEHLVLHLVKSNLGSVEGAVGTCGLLAILLTQEADRRAAEADEPPVCPCTGHTLGNIATVDGRWVCCGGKYPDHQPATLNDQQEEK